MSTESSKGLVKGRKLSHLGRAASASDDAITAPERQHNLETDLAVSVSDNQPSDTNRNRIISHVDESISDEAHDLSRVSTLVSGHLQRTALEAIQEALLDSSGQHTLAQNIAKGLISAVCNGPSLVQAPPATKEGDTNDSNDMTLTCLQTMLCSGDLEHMDNVDSSFCEDISREMKLNWMLVRWRTMDDHGSKVQAERPAEGEPGSQSVRQNQYTRRYINAEVHGGNLSHDAIVCVDLDKASPRNGHAKQSATSSNCGAILNKKGALDRFKLMYSLDADQGLWLAQQAWLQKKVKEKEDVGAEEFINTVRLINRYTSWYGSQLHMSTSGKKKKRLVVTSSRDVEKAWDELMAVVSLICQEKMAPLGEKMKRDLCAKSKALVAACKQLPGW